MYLIEFTEDCLMIDEPSILAELCDPHRKNKAQQPQRFIRVSFITLNSNRLFTAEQVADLIEQQSPHTPSPASSFEHLYPGLFDFNFGCECPDCKKTIAEHDAAVAHAATLKAYEKLRVDLETRFISSNNQWSKGRNSGLLECLNIIDKYRSTAGVSD
jgi:hypothetical protein